MDDSRSGRVLGQLQHWLGAKAAPADDGPLLERFVRQHDEDAFAELVSRHGPLVLGLCRRLLGHVHDAEDVFQATFLVLARKAGAIRKPESLSCWLHGVAYRLALKARDAAKRRRIHEQQARPLCETVGIDVSWCEVRRLLDEELQRLPEKQRLPLVLCYLEGLTQDEASRRLGWPRGTLKRRLEAGRERLRLRLTRRGVSLGAGLFAVALTETTAKGAVSTALRNATVRASLQFLTQETAALAATPAMLLAKGVLQTMATTKLKLGAMAILFFGCALTAAGLAIPQTPVEKQPENESQSSAAAQPAKNEHVRKDHYGDPLPPGAIARLGTVRLRQPRINSVVFTPDGKTAITGDLNGYIIYWDVATGRETRCLPRITRSINALAISHDGKVLACTDEEELSLREVASGKLLSQSSLKGSLQQMLALLTDNNVHIRQMLFTPDDATLVLREWGGTIHLWDVAGKKKLHELKGHNGNRSSMALSPDSKTLASASSEDPHIHLWDIASGKEKLHFAADNKGVESLAYSPDGKALVAIGSQPSFALFDPNTGKRLRTGKVYSGGLKEIAYAPDGKTLLGIDERTIHVLDAVSGKHLRQFDAPRRSIDRLTISPDGNTAATVMDTGGPTTFDLWNVAGGKLLHSFAGHRSSVDGLAFSADGATLYSSSQFDDSSGLLIWDATTGEPRGQIDNIPVNYSHHYALSPDGKLIAAGCTGSPRLLDPVNRKVVRSCIGCEENENITSLVWSADGKTLISSTVHIAGTHTMHVWDPTTGKRRSVIKAKSNNVWEIALSPDGALLAGSSDSSKVRLWSTASGKELRQIAIEPMSFITPIAFSPAGTLLACGGNRSISLWEPATGQLLRRWDARAYRLAFSSDGRTLVSTPFGYVADRYPGSATVRLWETATGKERVSFTGQGDAILTLAISRDGRRVASGNTDTTILVWDATGGAHPDAALSTEQLRALWLDLIDDDAGRAYRALWQLALAPKKALPFLAERLQPAAKVHKRPESERLRMIRALEAIEHMNTQEARRFLEALANGAPHAWLTEESRAICKRLAKQSVPTP